MPFQTAMSAMHVSEIILWVALALLFWKRAFFRRFPAMAVYLGLRAIAAPVLLLLFSFPARPWSRIYHSGYFFAYWTVYTIGVVLLFLVCIEVFRAALSPFVGLMKVGVVIFRWATLISIIVTFATAPFALGKAALIPEIANWLMRSISIVELCLLAFLGLSLSALRLSIRDLAFGIALGFGLLSANDLVAASILSVNASLTAPLQLCYEAMVLVALCTWLLYCLLPEHASKPVIMPASSAIHRWNEIASALGHTGTKVAVQQPANGFFLTDVEKVVDKVLTRNLKKNESEL